MIIVDSHAAVRNNTDTLSPPPSPPNGSTCKTSVQCHSLDMGTDTPTDAAEVTCSRLCVCALRSVRFYHALLCVSTTTERIQNTPTITGIPCVAKNNHTHRSPTASLTPDSRASIIHFYNSSHFKKAVDGIIQCATLRDLLFSFSTTPLRSTLVLAWVTGHPFYG